MLFSYTMTVYSGSLSSRIKDDAYAYQAEFLSEHAIFDMRILGAAVNKKLFEEIFARCNVDSNHKHQIRPDKWSMTSGDLILIQDVNNTDTPAIAVLCCASGWRWLSPLEVNKYFEKSSIHRQRMALNL